jgi:hypothetical protein
MDKKWSSSVLPQIFRLSEKFVLAKIRTSWPFLFFARMLAVPNGATLSFLSFYSKAHLLKSSIW